MVKKEKKKKTKKVTESKTSKKPTKKTSKKPTKKTSKKPTKKTSKKQQVDDLGIIFVDEDIAIDKESELEARRAYLEEARSQESAGD